MTNTVAVTGANGYLGSALVDHFLSRGWKVVALTRDVRVSEREGLTFRQFQLGQPIPDDLSCDALVHAAYDFRSADPDEIERLNVKGSIELLASGLTAGMRCIFISSQSAAAPRSIYGSAKRKVEEYCIGCGITVVRPGLITGPGGLYGKLSAFVARFPVVPLLGWGNQILYLVRREDLCAVLERILDGKFVAKSPIEVAYPQAFTFREVLRLLGQRHGRRVVFAPIPILMIRVGLRLVSRLGVGVGFREDNLDGLGQSVRPSIAELDIPLRYPIV